MDPDFQLCPNLNSSKLILSFQVISKPCCLQSTWLFQIWLPLFRISKFGHCHLQPEIDPQRLPLASITNLQILQTLNNTKHTLAGAFAGFLYDSSRFPFGWKPLALLMAMVVYCQNSLFQTLLDFWLASAFSFQTFSLPFMFIFCSFFFHFRSFRFPFTSSSNQNCSCIFQSRFVKVSDYRWRCVTPRDDARWRVRRQFGSGVHLEDRLLPFGARFVVWQRPASFIDIAVRRLAYPRCAGYCFVAHHTAFVSTADVHGCTMVF